MADFEGVRRKKQGERLRERWPLTGSTAAEAIGASETYIKREIKHAVPIAMGIMRQV